MPVVLDNDAGERVLLYGADGATLRKVVVDSSGRLVVVGPGGSGALTVSATDLDIRNLVKTLDELYAVLRTDAGVAYDARTRSWTITETVPVSATDLDIRNLTKTLDELYAVLRTDGGTAYDAREMYGYIGGAWQRQPLIFGFSTIYSEQIIVVGGAGQTVVTGAAPAANTLRVITALSVTNLTRAMTRYDFRHTDAGNPRLKDDPAGAGAGVFGYWFGWSPTLAATVADAYGTLAGDDVRAQFQGFDMPLNL